MGKRRAKQQKDQSPRVGDRPFRQVGLRAFVHATEDAQRVRDALAFTAGFDPDDEAQAKQFEALLEEGVSQGHFRNPIGILELTLKRAALVRRFWDQALGEPEVRGPLAAEVDQRLDDELVFWFRLDKQAAAQGRLRVADGEDVVLVRAKLATYPKDHGTGLRFLRGFFSQEQTKRLL
jgi:RNA-binding protein